MAWPDHPPAAQLDAYNAGLSGSVENVPDRGGYGYADVPAEYLQADMWHLKAGYYYPDELAAWLDAQEPEPDPDPAEPPVDEPDPPPPATGLAREVLAFLGEHTWTATDLAQVESHVHTATMMVKAYTRGAGFPGGEPAEDVAAVIVSCAARLVRNPTLDRTQTVGPFQTSPGTFQGWSLAELAVLHTYRRRAL